MLVYFRNEGKLLGLCLSNVTFDLLSSVRCPGCCLAGLSAPKMFANEGRNEEGGGGGKKKKRTKRKWGRRYMNQSIRESLCEYVISPLRLIISIETEG